MKLSEIDRLLLEDIQTDDHPSDFISSKSYNVLILRLPEVGSRKLQAISYAFVIEGEQCYMYNRLRGDLDFIGTLVDLEAFLDEKTQALIKFIKEHHFEIEALEESLYEGKESGDFMQRWLSDKKEVSLVYRLMFHAVLSFELFIEYQKRHDRKSFEELAYADVFEHMVRIRELAKDAMEKLDNLYDFYRAKVDERMNRNVYYLTLLSGIFMPLTLITGFFGMNTGGLPFVDDPMGTWYVIGVSIVAQVLFFTPFVLMNMKKIKRYTR